MGQVVSYDQISKVINLVREDKKVVFTNGCFDILHIGHVRYLQEARQHGDMLVVGVNSDASVKRLKGDERPVQNQEDRAAILAALEPVDYAVIFEEETPLDLIQIVRPDVLVKGGDWPIDQIVGSQFVVQNGGEVKSLQFVDGKSTTNLVEKIRKL